MTKHELQDLEFRRKRLEEGDKYILIKEKYDNGESESSIIKSILDNEDIIVRQEESDAFLLVKIFEYIDNNRHIDDFIKWLEIIEKDGLPLTNINLIKTRYSQFKKYNLAKAGLKKKEIELKIEEIEHSFNCYLVNNDDENIAEKRVGTQIELLKTLISDLEENMKKYGTNEADEDYDYWITANNIENTAKELNVNLNNTKYMY